MMRDSDLQDDFTNLQMKAHKLADMLNAKIDEHEELKRYLIEMLDYEVSHTERRADETPSGENKVRMQEAIKYREKVASAIQFLDERVR